MSDEGAGSKDTGQSWADRAGFPDRRLQKLQGCTCPRAALADFRRLMTC